MRGLNRTKSAIFISALTGCLALASVASATTWVKIVDEDRNDGEGFSMTQSSNWAKRGGGYGGYYRYLSSVAGDGSRTGTATWQTTVPYCGTYKVLVSAYKTENRTSDADYYYSTDYIPADGASGEGHTSISQIRSSSVLDWDTIGNFYYEKGQTVYVTLDGTDDSASDCADAVSWVLVSTESCRSAKSSSLAPIHSILLHKDK